MGRAETSGCRHDNILMFRCGGTQQNVSLAAKFIDEQKQLSEMINNKSKFIVKNF